MKNYEYSESSLIVEISKQFNITQEIAENYNENVKIRYPNIKKSRKILKNMSELPKNKPFSRYSGFYV